MSAANSPASSIAPSPSIQMSAGASTPAITPRPSGQPIAKIVTSKEWVLPPRPKPGRKPSADTPATKRKAQNRAAQRAFRERRATRVAELEEKLSEVEKERDVSELNLRNIINKLQMENKYLMKSLNDVKNDFTNFKNSMGQQSQPQSQHQSINNGSNHSSPAVYVNGTVNAPSPLNYFKPSNSNASTPQIQHQHQHQHQHSHQHPHPQQPQLHHQRSSSQVISPAFSNSPNTPSSSHTPSTTKTSISSSNNNTQSNDNYDCGVCIKDDCICESVGIRPPRNQQQLQQLQQQAQAQQQAQQASQPKVESIDSFQPMAPVSLKRKQPEEPVEIDYTSKFCKTTVTTGKKPMPKFKKFKKLSNNDQISDEAKNFTTNVFDGLGEGNNDGSNSNANSNFESPMEQCGFCSDDSPCVCREAAKEAASAIAELQNHHHKRESTLPPIRNGSISQTNNTNIKTNETQNQNNKLPVLHPGPTVEISEIHRSSISTPKATDSIEDSKKQLGDVTTIQKSQTSNVKKESTNGGGCTGNPGTCNQCQLDPMSTLFCTTIASKAEEEDEVKEPTNNSNPQQMNNIERAKSDSQKKSSPVSPPLSNVSSKVSSPLTVTSQEEELNSLSTKQTPSSLNSNSNSNGMMNSNNGSNGGFTNNQSSSSVSTPAGSTSSTLIPGSVLDQQKGIFIPCADAYKTLSRHKEFNSVDFSTLVGKLTTRGMQVEVQSVANVLRELDRRLYN